eukprot:3172844-Alexandrium_andersonii.AAC.1
MMPALVHSSITKAESEETRFSHTQLASSVSLGAMRVLKSGRAANQTSTGTEDIAPQRCRGHAMESF